MSTMVLPEDYNLIDRIEIHFRTGERIALIGDEAQQWSQAVDWGLRRFQLEQFEKYQKIVKNFEWKET